MRRIKFIQHKIRVIRRALLISWDAPSEPLEIIMNSITSLSGLWLILSGTLIHGAIFIKMISFLLPVVPVAVMAQIWSWAYLLTGIVTFSAMFSTVCLARVVTQFISANLWWWSAILVWFVRPTAWFALLLMGMAFISLYCATRTAVATSIYHKRDYLGLVSADRAS